MKRSSAELTWIKRQQKQKTITTYNMSNIHWYLICVIFRGHILMMLNLIILNTQDKQYLAAK